MEKSNLYSKLIQKSYVKQVNYSSLRRIYLLESLSNYYLRNKDHNFRTKFNKEIRNILRVYNIFHFFGDPNNYIGKDNLPYLNKELEIVYKLLGYLVCNTSEAQKIELECIGHNQIFECLKHNIEGSIKYLTKITENKSQSTSVQINDLYILKTIDVNNEFHKNVLIYWETFRSAYREMLSNRNNAIENKKELNLYPSEENNQVGNSINMNDPICKDKTLIDFMHKCFQLKS